MSGGSVAEGVAVSVTSRIRQASALALPFDDGEAHTCVTSPPYWGLRDYGNAHQLGLEPTPEHSAKMPLSPSMPQSSPSWPVRSQSLWWTGGASGNRQAAAAHRKWPYRIQQ